VNAPRPTAAALAAAADVLGGHVYSARLSARRHERAGHAGDALEVHEHADTLESVARWLEAEALRE
jgi:hypothetical protein